MGSDFKSARQNYQNGERNKINGKKDSSAESENRRTFFPSDESLDLIEVLNIRYIFAQLCLTLNFYLLGKSILRDALDIQNVSGTFLLSDQIVAHY